MATDQQLPYRRLRLHRPDLTAVAACLDRACRAAFLDASVDVLEACPDLSGTGEGEFRLAGRGLCGGATLVHAGGVPYLLPTPQRDRRYDVRRMLELAGCPAGLAIGAGAAASALFGKNAEFVANLGPLGNGCRVASVADDADRATGLANYRLHRADFAEINLLGDMLCSQGTTAGPVLRLQATGWRQPAAAPEGDSGWRVGHLAELLQRTLAAEFSGCDVPVGLGGVFRLSGTPARVHVMPDFSPTPLNCLDDVNGWLHFVDMPGPLVFLGTLLSHDPRDWGLRLEHFHGWNTQTEGSGGHYHYDVLPAQSQILAYFCLAEELVRVDPPGGVDAMKDD